MSSETERSARIWRMLELVSIADPGGIEYAEAASLAAELGVTDGVLVRAARHGLVPALTDLLRGEDLVDRVPAGVRHLLLDSLRWNRHKVHVMLAEARTVAEACRAMGVRVAFTKGIVCQATLFDGRGTRVLADIDLMIRPEQQDLARHALLDLGYVMGKVYDERRECLVDRAREDLMLYRLYPDHLPHFLRVDHESGLACHKVDVAFSLTWYGSAWQVPMDDVLSTTAEVPVTADPRDTLPTLEAGYGFLFLALHLFRECWFQRSIAENKLRLSQFADIWKHWQRFGRARVDEIRTLVYRFSLGPPVAWICHHTDLLYGSDLVTELGLTEFQVPDWLHSAAASDGSYLAWDGDMRARLRQERPVSLTPAAEPPFAAQARVSRG